MLFLDDFSKKDAHISSLMRKNSQQLERIAFLEEQSIKDTCTSSVEVQFNYLIPSMGKRYLLYVTAWDIQFIYR